HVPSRAEAVRVDGADARGAAEDEGAAGALQGRQAAAPAGDGQALPRGEDQPARRLPADLPADPGVLRALPDAAPVDRDAPQAVRAVDQGPFRAGSFAHLQSLRPLAF